MLDAQVDLAPLLTIDVPGGQISYRTAGTGRPLVFLHGIGSNAGSWAAQLEALSGQRQIIAWDAPGYGMSTPHLQERPTPEAYAESVMHFLDALGITECDMVGHSLGALMSGRFAASRPTRVGKLVLASCACGYDASAEGPFPETIQNRLSDLENLGPDGLADKRSANLLSEAGRPQYLEAVKDAMRQVTKEGYRRATYMLAQGALLSDASQITAPTLVICGSEDRITPEAVNRPVAKAISGARYVSLPGAGHALYLEQATAFNQTVSDFLAAP